MVRTNNLLYNWVYLCFKELIKLYKYLLCSLQLQR
nr:MAG TPA: hypothetical protein [Crassvirales sp.]